MCNKGIFIHGYRVSLFSCPGMSDCLTAWTAAHEASLSLTISQCLSKFTGDAIQPSHPLMALLLLPSIFPSIRDFSRESAVCIRWPKYWSISFSISLSNEYSGLISLTIDWFDLLAVQWILRSLPQHHSLKVLILWHSAFFILQLSELYVNTGNTIALILWTFVGRVMSLLFNMLSRLVIAFLPRGKCLLISWLQSPSAVDFGAQENKVSHCFHCFPIYLPWSDGTRCHDLSFLNVEF